MSLQRLFYPKSIAVVGASAKLNSGKLPYYQVLRDNGFTGRLYPVNPMYEEIDGVKVFDSVREIPDDIDLTIISVPVKLAYESLKDSVEKGARFVHFFTSGFGEIGNQKLEKDMVDLAREKGTRIVGPNCLGVLCTGSNLTFSVKLDQSGPGMVAFLGQSGGLSDWFLSMAQSRRIPINKAVSYGNQIDLKVEDFLEYFADDDTISVIAAYIEDIKDGKRFRTILQKLAIRKPVIILKGGATQTGARAARSHTGALASSPEIFSQVLHQTGCIEVETFEQLIDAVMAATASPLPRGPRLGFLGGGGGTSVISADLAVKQGLILPELEEGVKDRISQRISPINTSVTNPVDLGAFGFDWDVVLHTMKVMDLDRNLDMIVPFFTLGVVPQELDFDRSAFLNTLDTIKKPVFAVITKISENVPEQEANRIKLSAIFREAGRPVFQTMQDAARVIRKLIRWNQRTTQS